MIVELRGEAADAPHSLMILLMFGENRISVVSKTVGMGILCAGDLTKLWWVLVERRWELVRLGVVVADAVGCNFGLVAKNLREWLGAGPQIFLNPRAWPSPDLQGQGRTCDWMSTDFDVH